jgi:hypothetical protein
MTQLQTILKCPFRNPLVTKLFACEHALDIASRDGPGIACQSEDAHKRCGLLFGTLKAAALPTLGIPDDLAVMPASTITKIQCGGLEALSKDLEKYDPTVNINALVASVYESSDNFNNLDFSLVIRTIKNYKLRKRRQK